MGERDKGHLSQKGRVKLSVFANDMVLHIGIAKDSTKKLSTVVNKFSDFIGHKINV